MPHGLFSSDLFLSTLPFLLRLSISSLDSLMPAVSETIVSEVKFANLEKLKVERILEVLKRRTLDKGPRSGRYRTRTRYIQDHHRTASCNIFTHCDLTQCL